VEYYSTLKRNEKTWRIKCTLLSERNQFGKATHYMTAIIWQSGRGKTMETLKTRGCLGARGRDESAEHIVKLSYLIL
jgi:hypothetical protein